jgi:hypothetical protein
MRPSLHDILPLPPRRRIKGYVGPIDKELAETRAPIEKTASTQNTTNRNVPDTVRDREV